MTTSTDSLDFPRLAASLANLNLGALISCEPAAGGNDVTAYALIFEKAPGQIKKYVLTLFTAGLSSQANFSARLTRHLENSGLPVPYPVADAQGSMVQLIDGKPGLLFPAPPADAYPLQEVNESQCAMLGCCLARLHLAGADMDTQGEEAIENHRGIVWLNYCAEELAGLLPPGEAALLQEQVQRYRKLCDHQSELPSGPIHGSPLRKNILFNDNGLVSISHFFTACSDWLLLDVAIAVNDWCSDTGHGYSGEIDPKLATALLSAYSDERPFTACERQYWQDILCFTATRFWVSRLLARHRPDLLGGESTALDPEFYRQKLVRRIVGYTPLP